MAGGRKSLKSMNLLALGVPRCLPPASAIHADESDLDMQRALEESLRDSSAMFLSAAVDANEQGR